MRWLARLAAGVVVAIGTYCAAAALGGLIPNGAPQRAAGQATVTIHLLKGPIHVDMLLPLDPQTRAQFAWLGPQGIAMDHPAADWLIFGWGARDFYTTVGTYADVSAGAVWRGLTGDSAVMRVSVAGAFDPDWPVETLHLTPAEHAALTSEIIGSFRDGVATESLPQAGFSGWDRFFPARGRFHLFNTCNVWIGDTLRAAGIRFGLWTPTPYAVTLSARVLAP